MGEEHTEESLITKIVIKKIKISKKKTLMALNLS